MTRRGALPGNVVAISGPVAAALITLPGFARLRVAALGTQEYPQVMALYRLGLANSVPPNGTFDGARAAAAPNWLTTEQASGFLNIGRRAVLKRLTKGQLTGRKEAGRWRVDRRHVEELMGART
jgi:hypothetical protein